MTEQTQALIEKLKADRLAELRAAEEKRRADEEADRQRIATEFAGDVHDALAAAGCLWLLEFFDQNADRQEWNDDDLDCRCTLATFRVPGHRAVYLFLERPKDCERWRFPPEENQSHRWAADRDGGPKHGRTYHETIADALIAADERADPEPDPVLGEQP